MITQPMKPDATISWPTESDSTLGPAAASAPSWANSGSAAKARTASAGSTLWVSAAALERTRRKVMTRGLLGRGEVEGERRRDVGPLSRKS